MFNLDCFHSDWYLKEKKKINEKYKRIMAIEKNSKLTNEEKNRLLYKEDMKALKEDWDKVGEDFRSILGKEMDKHN